MLLLRTLYSLSLQLLFLFFFFLHHTLALASSATSFQKDPPSITYSFSLHIDTQYSHLGYWCLTLLTSSTPGLVHFTNVYLRTFSTLSTSIDHPHAGLSKSSTWPGPYLPSSRHICPPDQPCDAAGRRSLKAWIFCDRVVTASGKFFIIVTRYIFLGCTLHQLHADIPRSSCHTLASPFRILVRETFHYPPPYQLIYQLHLLHLPSRSYPE